MGQTTAAEALLRRDRLIVAGSLIVLAALAWLFVLNGGGTGMSVAKMTTWQFPPPIVPATETPWPAAYWLVMLAMWFVMMVAMMVPSAAPMILLYAHVTRHAQARGQLDLTVVPTAWFALGYLLSLLGFSAGATFAQWGLERMGLVHAMKMWSLNPWLSSGILVAAGIYQISPLKDVCLRHCRSPAQFLSQRWRKGSWGALRLGVTHGLFCVGCCWVLMTLLFVGGVMNLIWIAGLSVFILVEKVVPHGHLVSRIAGLALVGGGIYTLSWA
jgi:predicted metal-binding membrane protein